MNHSNSHRSVSVQTVIKLFWYSHKAFSRNSYEIVLVETLMKVILVQTLVDKYDKLNNKIHIIA